MNRALRPATARDQIELKTALELLKNVHDRVRQLGCPRTLKKIRSAIKSAEGAQRHLRHRLANGGVR